MIGFLGLAYPWVKAAHVIFVIFWMAGLFMLPRFLVYHVEAPEGDPERARWIEREARLIRIILNPSLVLVWALGLALVLHTGAWAEHWFLAKFVLVVLLSGYAGWMSALSKKLARGERAPSGRTLRLLNEVPGVAALLIVVLVIVRPF